MEKRLECMICKAQVNEEEIKKEGFICPSCGAPKSQFVPLSAAKI